MVVTLNKLLDVVCVGAAIVDIPLQPVSKNIFDCESYPLEQISMTIGGDAINEATVLSRLGHKVGLVSMVGHDAVGNFILEHCEKNGINTEGMKVRDGIDTSINIGLVTADGERTFVSNRNGSLWKESIEDIDIENTTRARVLSYGSFFNNPRLDNRALVEIFDKAKELDYGVKEALRTLKTNIQFCGDDIKTILLTSSIPEEGKSTVTVNLARSMAESGLKVAYVDCDIRKSVMIGRLGAHTQNGKPIVGLSHYLTGQKKLEEVIYRTSTEGMHMIFAGPTIPNPTEILANHYFKEMIEALRESYDVILLDTPPLGSVIDAAVIAPQADGAILVVQQGKVSGRFIKTVKKQLGNSGVKILGVVLNKVEVKKQGYYKKYYGNAYE